MLKSISEPKYVIIWFSTEFTQCPIISTILKRLFASLADNHMHFKTALELFHITRNLLSKVALKNYPPDLKKKKQTKKKDGSMPCAKISCYSLQELIDCVLER